MNCGQVITFRLSNIKFHRHYLRILNCWKSDKGSFSCSTVSTFANSGPLWHQLIHCSSTSTDPCPTAVTLPSASFFTHPLMPNWTALSRVEARKYTPWTFPFIRSLTCCIALSFGAIYKTKKGLLFAAPHHYNYPPCWAWQRYSYCFMTFWLNVFEESVTWRK